MYYIVVFVLILLLVMIIVDPCVHMSDFLSLIRYCTVVIIYGSSRVGVLYKGEKALNNVANPSIARVSISRHCYRALCGI